VKRPRSLGLAALSVVLVFALLVPAASSSSEPRPASPGSGTDFGYAMLEVEGIGAVFINGVEGLGSETEVIEHKFVTPQGMEQVRKIPGSIRWYDLRVIKNVDQDRFFWNWRKSIEVGRFGAGRHDGTITMVSSEGVEYARFCFFRGWPSSYEPLVGWNASEGVYRPVAVTGDLKAYEMLVITVERYMPC